MRYARPIRNLSGQKFGRYTVIKLHDKRANRGQTLWVCRCDCGNERLVMSQNLTRGNSKSCGCLCRENTSKANSTHRLTKHPAYKSWLSMRKRCYGNDPHAYKYYGSRGIKMCERWNKFENFWEDMNSTWKDGLEIDRIDNDGNYCPENCRWATRKEQVRNTRFTHWVEFKGQRKSVAEWSEITGIPYGTLHSRVYTGWTGERALTQPIRDRGW